MAATKPDGHCRGTGTFASTSIPTGSLVLSPSVGWGRTHNGAVPRLSKRDVGNEREANEQASIA